MHAVIRTGGKQYRVTPGQRLRVERLPGDPGDTVEIRDVLLISGEDRIAVGTPTVKSTRVVAEIVDQGRGRKINVFKYKNKTRYRRLRGHRQEHTDLLIREIVAGRKRYKAPEPIEEAPPVEEDGEAPAAADAAEATLDEDAAAVADLSEDAETDDTAADDTAADDTAADDTAADDTAADDAAAGEADEAEATDEESEDAESEDEQEDEK